MKSSEMFELAARKYTTDAGLEKLASVVSIV